MKTEIMAVCIIAAVFIAVMAAYLLQRYIINAIYKKTLTYQSDLMEKHCAEVQNMYLQTRGWRHDYRNHMQVMKTYLAMGKLEELETYLSDLDTDLTTVDTVIKTGNIMIDAILNSKISLAKNSNIKVEAKAIVPKELETSIKEVDLSVIIGNLMDNAMEACMKIENPDDRFIRVYIDILKGQLYIYIINSTSGQLKRAGKIYETSKNKREHGFGLMRVDKVVERYNGYLERQDEEGVFATEIMLPLMN
jgi:sensor histidine kinase regulating citrate/malate metabolism